MWLTDTPLSSLLGVAWVGAYLYMGLQHAGFYLRIRKAQAHLVVSLIAFGLGTYSLGAALAGTAASAQEGMVATHIAASGGALTMPGLVLLAVRLSGKDRPRVKHWSLALGAAGLVGSLGGLLYAHPDPLSAAEGPPPFLHFVPPLLLPGLIWTAVATTTTVAALLPLFRRVRHSPAVAPTTLALVLCLAAVAHDVAVLYGPRDRPLWLGHTGMLLMLALTDLLAHRFAERKAELKRRTRAVRESQTKLSHAQDEAIRQRQLGGVEELGAIVAHEVRNPLAILKNAVSGLRRSKEDSASVSMLLDIVDEETQRLTKLTDDLATYAQPVTIHPEPIDLRELVEVSMAEACARDRAESVEINLETAADIGHVQGDPELLRRALIHVIGNALQAMPSTGRLTIHTERRTKSGDSVASISVLDTGEGMSAEVLGKATKAFFTTRPAGTGLGLTIADRVVTAHQGSLQIEGGRTSGTRVVIDLPVNPLVRVAERF